MKNKKNLFIIFGIITALIICSVFAMIFLKRENNDSTGGTNETTEEELVVPNAPAENTENLVQSLEKVEIISVSKDVIEFKDNTRVEQGEKVAVWVYSTPKFLGYFEVVIENNVKVIKGLNEAMKGLNIEPGEHNLAIVTEEGESIGYIDVYIEENTLFEDEKAAEVSKYTTKEIIEEVEIEYKTETKKDSSKKSNYKEVTQKGINGLSSITYKVTYDEQGNEISKEKISEAVIKEVINEIVTVGTADFSTSGSIITASFTGFMCTEDQTITYEGEKACNDFVEIPSFNGITIDDSIHYVVEINEVSINPIKITKKGSLYKGTYKGKTHYFDFRGGGGDNTPLTPELCKHYKLNCGA